MEKLYERQNFWISQHPINKSHSWQKMDILSQRSWKCVLRNGIWKSSSLMENHSLGSPCRQSINRSQLQKHMVALASPESSCATPDVIPTSPDAGKFPLEPLISSALCLGLQRLRGRPLMISQISTDSVQGERAQLSDNDYSI